MNENYRAWIDETDQGPFTIGALRAMENHGKVEASTPVRRNSQTDWSTWGEVSKDVEVTAQKTRTPIAPSLRRDGIRQTTAYPFARKLLSVPFWISAGFIGICLIGMIDPGGDGRSFWVIAFISSIFTLLGSGIWWLLGNAILDIADCAIKQG